MIRSQIFVSAALAFLCGFPALSQQQPQPPSPAAPPTDASRGPRPRVRDFNYRVFPGNPGVHTELRIAPPGIWWKNPDIAQKISLTADQQKRMDDIFQQSRLQLIDLKANVEKQEVILEPMLSANPPDTNKVLAQIDHVASARAELEKANARMLLGIRSVLSADQWTKLRAEMRDNQRFMFHFQGGRGGIDGPGFGPVMGPKGSGPDVMKLQPRTPGKPGPGGPLSLLNPPGIPALGPDFDVLIGGSSLDSLQGPSSLSIPEPDIDVDVDLDL